MCGTNNGGGDCYICGGVIVIVCLLSGFFQKVGEKIYI